MKLVPNNFDEYDFYKLICAIAKYKFNEQAINNKVLSQICLNYDLNSLYKNVNYNLNNNEEIESVNFNNALFVAASFNFVLLNQRYNESISVILKNDEECFNIIQSYDDDYYIKILPIVSNLIATQKALDEEIINNENQTKKLL